MNAHGKERFLLERARTDRLQVLADLAELAYENNEPSVGHTFLVQARNETGDNVELRKELADALLEKADLESLNRKMRGILAGIMGWNSCADTQTKPPLDVQSEIGTIFPCDDDE